MPNPKHPSRTSAKKPKNPPKPPQTCGARSRSARRSSKPQPLARPQFITIADAAARLGVSEKTIRRWITRSEIAAVRVGSHIRIPLGAFLHFIGGLPPARP